MHHPLAHHLGEQSLATLLLLGTGTLPLVAAIGRSRLAAARARVARQLRTRRPPGRPTHGKETALPPCGPRPITLAARGEVVARKPGWR